jgi:hypothetical protein
MNVFFRHYKVAGMQMDLDEAVGEVRASEERLRRSVSDAARLAEELRQEQVSWISWVWGGLERLALGC